jgi:hypothetical protein
MYVIQDLLCIIDVCDTRPTFEMSVWIAGKLPKTSLLIKTKPHWGILQSDILNFCFILQRNVALNTLTITF